MLEWSLWTVFFVLVAYGVLLTGLIYVAEHRGENGDNDESDKSIKTTGRD